MKLFCFILSSKKVEKKKKKLRHSSNIQRKNIFPLKSPKLNCQHLFLQEIDFYWCSLDFLEVWQMPET